MREDSASGCRWVPGLVRWVAAGENGWCSSRSDAGGRRPLLGIVVEFCRPSAVPLAAERWSTGTRGGCADLAQTWFSSFRSGIGLRRHGARGAGESMITSCCSSYVHGPRPMRRVRSEVSITQRRIAGRRSLSRLRQTMASFDCWRPEAFRVDRAVREDWLFVPLVPSSRWASGKSWPGQRTAPAPAGSLTKPECGIGPAAVAPQGRGDKVVRGRATDLGSRRDLYVRPQVIRPAAARLPEGEHDGSNHP